jgi:hypothetical protein
MDVHGVSHAAAPLEPKASKRPVDAPPAASPTAAAAEDARVKAPAPAQISQKTQLLVEQLDRFTYAYTFLDPDTGDVVSRWPQTRTAGEHGRKTPPGHLVDAHA